MSMPAQKPGQSRQDFATPDDFIAAVKHRLGITEFVVDLAAGVGNAKAIRFLDKQHDSLAYDWTRYRDRSWKSRWCWLNPPFEDIAPWARKCLDSQWLQIALLVPASVGSNWWAEHVDGRAYVLFPRPRLSFDGVAPYPKDVALALYGMNPGYECWDWKGT
jgi:phage N-6-adenine-methyltransferase